MSVTALGLILVAALLHATWNLCAMSFTPVSYVAPAREVSIVIGAYLGAKVLKEGDSTRRLVAAIAMAAGVVALALG